MQDAIETVIAATVMYPCPETAGHEASARRVAGGLVDRNRYKGICQERAEGLVRPLSSTTLWHGCWDGSRRHGRLLSCPVSSAAACMQALQFPRLTGTRDRSASSRSSQHIWRVTSIASSFELSNTGTLDRRRGSARGGSPSALTCSWPPAKCSP